MFSNVFICFHPPKSCRLWDNVEVYCTFGQAADAVIIRHMCFACWLTKVTDAHTEYVVLLTFPRQQWWLERALTVTYTNIASLVWKWKQNVPSERWYRSFISQTVIIVMWQDSTRYQWSQIYSGFVCTHPRQWIKITLAVWNSAFEQGAFPFPNTACNIRLVSLVDFIPAT
jgi:hypothetical protein